MEQIINLSQYWNKATKVCDLKYTNWVRNIDSTFCPALTINKTTTRYRYAVIPDGTAMAVNEIRTIPYSSVKIDYGTPDTVTSVYIHPNCKIPRSELPDTLPKKRSPETADWCVLPEYSNDMMRHYITRFCCVYQNTYDNTYGIIVMTNTTGYFDNPLTYIGKPLTDVGVTDPRGQSCTICYMGWTVLMSKKIQWIADYMSDKFPRVISERHLQKILQSPQADITKEVYDGLKNMFNSKDTSISSMAIHTLASLNYSKYPTLVKFLFMQYKDNIYSVKKGTNKSVDYMYNSLDISYYGQTLKECTETEYEIIKDDLYDYINRQYVYMMDKFISQFGFLQAEIPDLVLRLKK